MKTCFKCGVEKPLGEYYRHKMMADGHLNKCKECAKADANAHRSANLDKYKAYEQVRAQLPHRRELSKRTAAKWVKKNPELARHNRMKHPEKYKARSLVGNALRKGALTKMPCEVCGNSKSHAHHEDYSRPLDVMWLCPVHHAQRHKELMGRARA